MTGYLLHYAPDNASLIVRLVLEELRAPYRTRLVDRSTAQQRSDRYRALNPVGRIPALETPVGPMFETGAIVLWLADTHGDLFPAAESADRPCALSWLFFLSNTLHAELRTLFYPEQGVGPDSAAQAALRAQTRINLAHHFTLLDRAAAQGIALGDRRPTICDLYAAALLRWSALYPVDADRDWFRLARWPNLARLVTRIDERCSVHRVAMAEGLGPTPFSDPHLPDPPEGSAL
ncbi:glutathione S-transferase family protein [Marivita sp.]|uniref:glutathione S-transferase family protein n=1 Tax=Marivita sp. TaxID=2003365 RepID=UPI0025C49FCD|nr:glutathione S-transferase family protein [Marivita sp.]